MVGGSTNCSSKRQETLDFTAFGGYSILTIAVI